MKKLKKTFKWGTLSKGDYQLIGKVAKRAIERDIELVGDQSRLAKRGQLDLVMDLEVCHARHFQLRLKEMLSTKDTFSLMHDIYMIAGSINKETFGWDGLGVPRFSTPVGLRLEERMARVTA